MHVNCSPDEHSADPAATAGPDAHPGAWASTRRRAGVDGHPGPSSTTLADASATGRAPARVSPGAPRGSARRPGGRTRARVRPWTA